MKRNTKVTISNVHPIVREVIGSFRWFNDAVVSKTDKVTGRIEIKFIDGAKFWFDPNQVEKA